MTPDEQHPEQRPDASGDQPVADHRFSRDIKVVEVRRSGQEQEAGQVAHAEQQQQQLVQR